MSNDIRAYMYNRWNADMYNKYNHRDPTNKYYGYYNWQAVHSPLTIDSNPQYTIELDRHCNGACTYNIGAVSRQAAQDETFRKIDSCSDQIGSPYVCARGFLGDKTRFAGNVRYDRLGH